MWGESKIGWDVDSFWVEAYEIIWAMEGWVESKEIIGLNDFDNIS